MARIRIPLSRLALGRWRGLPAVIILNALVLAVTAIVFVAVYAGSEPGPDGDPDSMSDALVNGTIAAAFAGVAVLGVGLVLMIQPRRRGDPPIR